MFLKSALKPINIAVTVLAALSALPCLYIFIIEGFSFKYIEADTLVYFFFFLAVFIFSLLLKWLITTIIKNIV